MPTAGSLRRVIVQLEGDQTETIPVEDDYELPLLRPDEMFVIIPAADGSEVAFRSHLVRILHLVPKAA